MKNVAKCDTWCELQNPVNHRVFERKLRPKPSGRGHACLGVTNRRQVPWKGAPERVRAPSCRTLSHHEALSTSRVVWECSPNRAVNSVQG
ncbi:unnamed protein product [Brassica napus]|uniref:(rape) hypothetical protein n=1 Tax=Brassica napus TaxID=3708 RepID=A0A816SJV5_BRANA|nr:unnamed protein product [Brassica napus]